MGVSLDDYEKVFGGAIGAYDQLLVELQELYKKYARNIKIPEKANAVATGVESRDLRARIINESRLKFDLFNDGDAFSAKSEFVKIVKKGKGDTHEVNEYSPFEDKLSGFITQNSKSVVSVIIPDKTKARLNFLLLGNCSDLPIEILVEVGNGSKLDLFEWFGSVSAKSSMFAPLHVVNVGKDSNVEVSIIHNENAGDVVGSLNFAKVLDNSTLRMSCIYNGGSITKSTTFADAVGKSSSLLLNEIVLGNAEQKFDINTLMFNSNKSTKAVLNSGAVLEGKALCMLKGYAKVTRDAAGSSSKIEERGLVLDPEARIQFLPDMSIACRDVESVSHSAATAPIDADVLFYLTSRGVDEERAKRMFVASFLSKYLESVGNDIVKEVAISIFLDKLDKGTNSQVPEISAKNLWVVPKKK